MGEMNIIVVYEVRETVVDFVAPADLITFVMVDCMAKYASALIFAPLSERRCEELDLEMMVGRNTSLHATPFTVSVDLLGEGCTTGISASVRAKTLRALAKPETTAEELGRPGHIFPLMAKERGVIRRAGHTEAAVDLARLAGLQPAGVLVEIMNDDGTMARLPQLMEMAKKFDLKIIAIRDLIAYRLKQESLVEKGVEVHLPTAYGDFRFIPFKQKSNGLEHMV